MDFDIRPHEGVGPLRLGMTREEVAKVMSRDPKALPCQTEGDTEAYYDSGLSIQYDPGGNVEFIEVSGNSWMDPDYEGVDLFRTPAEEVVEHICQFDAPDPDVGSENTDYLFPKLILTLWRPHPEYGQEWEGGPTFFATVGIGAHSYLEGCRRGVGDPLSVEWRTDVEPSP